MGTITFLRPPKNVQETSKSVDLVFLESVRMVLKYIEDMEQSAVSGSSIETNDLQDCYDNIRTWIVHSENTCTKSQTSDEAFLFSYIQLAINEQNAKAAIVRRRIKLELEDCKKDHRHIIKLYHKTSRCCLFLKRVEEILTKATYGKLKVV